MASLQGLYYPFGIIQGETFKFSFELSIGGVEQLYTDYTFIGQLKEANGGIITIADLVFIGNIDPNIVDVSIPSTVTSTIVLNDLVYEIKMTNISTNEITTIFYGPFTVKTSLVTAPIMIPIIP